MDKDIPVNPADPPSWHNYFQALCRDVARRSKDQSSKFGCVIVGPDKEIRSVGYNSFPRGINDNVPERQTRPEKYYWMAHAERNAIYNAARVGIPLKGCTLYISWPPCTDCAIAIIQSGIREVIVETMEVLGKGEQWEASVRVSKQMLHEAGVVLRLGC